MAGMASEWHQPAARKTVQSWLFSVSSSSAAHASLWLTPPAMGQSSISLQLRHDGLRLSGETPHRRLGLSSVKREFCLRWWVTGRDLIFTLRRLRHTSRDRERTVAASLVPAGLGSASSHKSPTVGGGRALNGPAGPGADGRQPFAGGNTGRSMQTFPHSALNRDRHSGQTQAR